MSIQKMQSFPVTLGGIEDIRAFIAITSRFPYEMDLRGDRYVVDAKSVLGILSLGANKQFILDVYSEDCSEVITALNDFIVY